MNEHLDNAASSHPAEDAATVAPMGERTLTALQGSIEKWKAIEAGTRVDGGGSDCPLCVLFDSVENPDGFPLPCSDGCFGCPVSNATGKSGCSDTPYMVWAKATGRDFPRIADTPERIALARAEREFLESLLP